MLPTKRVGELVMDCDYDIDLPFFRNMKSAKGGMSLTTFTDKQNLNLLVRINKSRQLHLVPCTLNGKYVLRLSVNYEFATPEIISKLQLQITVDPVPSTSHCFFF